MKWRKYVSSARLLGQLYTARPMQHIFASHVMQRFIQQMHFPTDICELFYVMPADIAHLVCGVWIIRCFCVVAVTAACMVSLPNIGNGLSVATWDAHLLKILQHYGVLNWMNWTTTLFRIILSPVYMVPWIQVPRI